MAEYIEKDYHYSTRYALIKNGERIEFNSEQDACEFLGVKKCSVASCFRKGYKCKGYEIERCGISTHGETNTRLHKIWESMIARCEYEKHPYYADYGGRGITVCDEWHNYIEFRDWAITHGYNDDLTIDRIKNEKGYDASNCRWVTMREQQNNKRSNHIVYLGEIGHTISEWSKILGIGKTTIRMRLESGWSDEEALTIPVRKRARGYRPSASCGAKMDGERRGVKPMNLEWNVWVNELNANKIKPFNVFNHYSFNKAITSIFKKRLRMDEFEEMIDKEAMYYFWCKAEYEVMIGGLFERGAEAKIDIYSQLKLNWDRFIDYLWNAYIKED